MRERCWGPLALPATENELLEAIRQVLRDHDPARQFAVGLSKYDQLLRGWMVMQLERFVTHGSPPAVLQYKVLRMLSRDVKPDSREVVPLFLDWAMCVSDAVGKDDGWQQMVRRDFHDRLVCKRFEWGESNSDG